MCGIVGYVGYKNATDVVVEGLKKLEYRGYDSAGIATLLEKSIEVTKCEGKVKNLEEKISKSEVVSGVAIGHTRWATHGKPSDVNSHPHQSNKGEIAVVHNGIIENYIELKKELKKKGYTFESETDTEVIPNMIHMYYEGDLFKAVKKAITRFKGSYAIAVICENNLEEIVIAKKESPLVIGLGENENIIASDIPAILKHTKNICIMEDNEIGIVKRGEVLVYDAITSELVNKCNVNITYDEKEAEKGGYDHFMLKEIHDQPTVVKNILRMNEQIDVDFKRYNRIYMVACGTAYYAGLIGVRLLEKKIDTPIICDVASEFRYNEPKIDTNTLVIVVSQSGETADTLAAVKLAKEKGATTVGLINVVGSTIARTVDEVIYTHAGPEIAVASTKAYTAQIMTFYNAFKSLKLYDFDDIENISLYIEEMLKEEDYIKSIAEKYKDLKNIFYIGRGLDYRVALEGALKFKEITYKHAEAYQAGELKHGPISLVEDGTVVLGIITCDSILEKTLSNLKETKARGAKVILITNTVNDEVKDIADEIIAIPKTDSNMSAVIANIPQQIFAYYVSVFNGNDVDMPRNLAKSVTVE